MRLIQVGPDKLDEYDIDREADHSHIDYLIYWYKDFPNEDDGWLGNGQAAGIGKDGLIYIYNLENKLSSFYSAINTWEERLTYDEFFAQQESIHDPYYRQEIIDKVKEYVDAKRLYYYDIFYI